MTHRLLVCLLFLGVTLASCSDDEDAAPSVDAPSTYDFTRDGQNTVDFSGQTTRINMAHELADALLSFDQTTEEILGMYQHEAGATSFSDPTLNSSDKNVRSKVAASRDYFATNTVEGTIIKEQFEDWMARQVNEVFVNEEVLAEPGIAGQVADGSSVRYVSAQGLEYNQLVGKGLIGAMMVDQMLNNYLSPAVLDEASNRDENNTTTLADGKPYTTMEHKWDEAYGYAYGASANVSDPNVDLGSDDFLNKYISRVEDDPDFTGIADEIFQAFKLGRAAIVAQNYGVRDQQAAIIREKVSEVIGIRTVYYLQQGKATLEGTTPDYGATFHNLSEAYGFMYSLRFTRQPDNNLPYASSAEVDDWLQQLLSDGEQGLWDVSPETLDDLSEAVANRFNFSVTQAATL